MKGNVSMYFHITRSRQLRVRVEVKGCEAQEITLGGRNWKETDKLQQYRGMILTEAAKLVKSWQTQLDNSFD